MFSSIWNRAVSAHAVLSLVASKTDHDPRRMLVYLNASQSPHCTVTLCVCLHPEDGPSYSSYTNLPRPCEPVCETPVPLVVILRKSSPLGHITMCLPHISSEPSGRSQFPSLLLHPYMCVCVCVCVCDRAGERVFLSVCTAMENPSEHSGPA